MIKDKQKSIKKFFIKVGQTIVNERHWIYLAIPFILMDLITRIMGYKVDFFPAYYPVPNIFTLLWVILFVVIIASLKGVAGRIAYWILFTLFFILFLTNTIYYSLTNFYFSFHLLQMTDEGSSYILDTIIHTNPIVYVLAIIVFIIAKVVARKKPEVENNHFGRLAIVFVVFVVLHSLTPLLLGHANSELKWNTFKNPRNTYKEFSDCNKSMKVSGLYEYSFRNLYITYLKPEEKISADDENFLKNIYTEENTRKDNDYTGMFKGKNLIFLQLEGMDDWLLTKETTPNLYALKQHSLDFTDHYSIYTGGGSTFNSEFAVNTGFTTPLSYIENVYSFNTNTFPYTMAKLFKNQNYSVNAFHMNSSDFYSRGVNYKSWGYDNYYGLKDIQKYSGLEYELDRELILNKTFYEKMFKQDGPFVNYIISYTPHKPFTSKKEVGKLVAEMKYKDGNVPDLSEEDCAKLMVGETDYMVGLLIQALKDNNLYDNTVIVAYADHYLYTIDDKSVLDNNKNTYKNLINHTPFFIWSSDVNPKKIKATTMQTNILPTVLNLFGINYNTNNYLSKDALASDYVGFAFYTDYSWYDGKAYVENNKVVNGKKINQEKFNTLNKEISDIIKKNDLTLKYDYFKKLQ